MFYTKNIFFDINDVDPVIRGYLEWNPMVGLIADYRNVLLYDQWPDWKDYLVHTGAACSILLVGILGYVRLDRYLPRVVS